MGFGVWEGPVHVANNPHTYTHTHIHIHIHMHIHMHMEVNQGLASNGKVFEGLGIQDS